MDRDRIVLRLVLTCSAAVQPNCLFIPSHVREPLQGTLTRTADGQPVQSASVSVETSSVEHRSIATYETRTDERGHWLVPAVTELVIVVPATDGERVQDKYTFRTTDGQSLTVRSWTTTEPGAKLRSTFEPLDLPERLLLPVAGLGYGEGQGASLHVGAAGLLLVGRGAAGLRATVAPGVRAVAANAGIVVSPRILLLPAVELNVRWLRPWKGGEAGGAEYGPELAIDVLTLRFSVSALSRELTTALTHRHFLFGVGLGFL